MNDNDLQVVACALKRYIIVLSPKEMGDNALSTGIKGVIFVPSNMELFEAEINRVNESTKAYDVHIAKDYILSFKKVSNNRIKQSLI